MSKKKFDLSPYLDCYIHVDISVSEFLKKVKKTPFRIVDFDIQYAIEILHQTAIKGTQKESRIAKEILKQSGLSAFITKEAMKKKTDNPKWAYWKNRPEELIEIIMDTEERIRPIWIKHDTNSLPGRKKAVSEIFEYLFEEKPSNDLLVRISKSERSSYTANVVLSIVAEIEGFSYASLYKFYNNTHKDLKKSIEKERKGISQKKRGADIKKLSLKDKKLEFNIQDIKKNPYEGIIFYREAYGYYKAKIPRYIPFLTTKADLPPYNRTIS